MTIYESKAIVPTGSDIIHEAIVLLMPLYAVNTTLREAAFIAQIAHESGGYRYLRELWGPTPAQAKYEGRKDLGNTFRGDGFKFRGRGLIQVTGRANYSEMSLKLFGTEGVLLNNPELLETPENAVRSALIFWNSRGLNRYADEGDIQTITRRINGGYNGLAERQQYYNKALIILREKGA